MPEKFIPILESDDEVKKKKFEELWEKSFEMEMDKSRKGERSKYARYRIRLDSTCSVDLPEKVVKVYEAEPIWDNNKYHFFAGIDADGKIIRAWATYGDGSVYEVVPEILDQSVFPPRSMGRNGLRRVEEVLLFDKEFDKRNKHPRDARDAYITEINKEKK